MPQKEILFFCNSTLCHHAVPEGASRLMTAHTFSHRVLEEDRKNYTDYYLCSACGCMTAVPPEEAETKKPASLKEYAEALKMVGTGRTKNTGQYSEPDYNSIESCVAALKSKLNIPVKELWTCVACSISYFYTHPGWNGYTCPQCGEDAHVQKELVKILPSDACDIPAAPDTKGGM